MRIDVAAICEHPLVLLAFLTTVDETGVLLLLRRALRCSFFQSSESANKINSDQIMSKGTPVTKIRGFGHGINKILEEKAAETEDNLWEC
jgi:hypothetical protein